VGAGSFWHRVQTLTRAVVCGRKSVEVICGSCSVDNAHGIWRSGGDVTSSSSRPELGKKLKDQCQQTHTWTTYKFPAENAKEESQGRGKSDDTPTDVLTAKGAVMEGAQAIMRSVKLLGDRGIPECLFIQLLEWQVDRLVSRNSLYHLLEHLGVN
jgi:hypothetical protein